MDGQADELQDAEVVLGRQLPELAAEVRLVEEAGLERQLFDDRPRHPREDGHAARTIDLEPVAPVGGWRRLVLGRRRRQQRHLVLVGEEVEDLEGPHLISPAGGPGVAGGDEEDLHPIPRDQTSFRRCPSFSRLVLR